MAWGSDVAATQLTSITTEQFFDQVPTLNPRETAHAGLGVAWLHVRLGERPKYYTYASYRVQASSRSA